MEKIKCHLRKFGMNMSNNNQSKNSLLWITNIPMPYRVAVWDCLDAILSLRVVFLSDADRVRGSEMFNAKRSYLSGLGIRSPFALFGNDVYLNLRKMLGLLKRDSSPVIYFDGFFSPTFMFGILISRFRQRAILIGYRSTLKSHRFKGFLASKARFLVLNLATLVVTAGPASSQAVKSVGVSPSKILELFNTVDVYGFYNDSLSSRQENSSKHRYLFVGQLIERKNVENVVRAFATAKGPLDCLEIVGSGKLFERISEVITELKLSGSVILLGHKTQEEVTEIYARSDTLILASTEEVWGLVANEALACGLHVVISENCGAAESLKGMKGVYICGTDTESIAENMRLSRINFKGQINNPEILKFTPEKFADELKAAISRLGTEKC